MSAVAPIISPPTLADLVAQRIALKRAEDKAIEARKKVDEQIIASLPKKDEGTSSEVAGDFKVAVTFGLNRKVDTDALQANWNQLTPAVQAAFKWAAGVTLPGLRALEGKDRTLAAKFITSTPSAPSLKIEVA
jgi:hypothetical protein